MYNSPDTNDKALRKSAEGNMGPNKLTKTTYDTRKVFTSEPKRRSSMQGGEQGNRFQNS